MKLFTVDLETDEGVYNGVVIAENEIEAINVYTEWAQATYLSDDESIEDIILEYGRPEATEWVFDIPGPARALNWKGWQPFEGDYH